MVAFLKRFRLSRRAALVLSSLALFVACLVGYAFYNLNPLMLSMAEAKTSQLAVEAINKAVSEVTGVGIGYGDLITVQTDSNGRITMLQANTLLMNDLASQAGLAAQRNLDAIEDEGILLPLGSALGVDLFAGAGPRFRVSIIPVGSVSTRFVTAFDTAGINQTRHEISLECGVQMTIVVPSGAKAILVTAQVPVAESIIVGEVPGLFINVPQDDSILNLVP